MRNAFVDWLTGSGKHAVSVPAMDGALRPNDRLDAAQPLHVQPGVDNVVVSGESILFSVDGSVVRMLLTQQNCLHNEATFPSDVTCLSATGDLIAVGLDAGGVRIFGRRFPSAAILQLDGRPATAPVALHFEDEDTLLIALGSQKYRPSDWRRDLMDRNASGSVWRMHLPSSRATLLADDLAYPYGIAVTKEGAILVSESWAHRIIELSSGEKRVLVDDLPFYPARLSMAPDGNVVLAGFAPRCQLVEFVLREKRLRSRMIAEIPEPYWMSPALSSGQDCWEPLQEGQVRRHGVLKPWAPTRSYGLVATMHPSGRFVESYHCRAGGRWHGTTSAVAVDSSMFVTAKGGGGLLRVERHV